MMLLSLWPIRVVLAAVVLVVAAAAGWWFFVREDAQLAEAPLAIRGTPTASAGETPSPTAGDDPSTTPNTSDPGVALSDGYTLYTLVSEHDAVEGRAEAAYFADEQLARIGVPSTAKGATFDISGQFALGPDGLDPRVPAVIVVGLTTLSSDEGMRDNRVRQALEISSFPTATFTASSLEGWTGDIAEGESVELALAGTMDLHGVQRDLTWDVIATRQGDVITALATTNFLYADFDIPILNIGGFVSVEEDVTLTVQLIAVAAS
jgi:polyisoprenoid-binding protein YceI